MNPCIRHLPRYVPMVLLAGAWCFCSAGDRSNGPSAPGNKRISLELSSGAVVGGNQRRTGLIPEPAMVVKTGFGLKGSYFFDKVGLEAGYVVYGATHALKGNYWPEQLFSQSMLRLGAIFSIYEQDLPLGVFKIRGAAGMNYSFVKVHDEYRRFLDTGFTFYRGYARGLGYYYTLGLCLDLKERWTAGIWIRYEFENPYHDKAPEAVDAHVISLPLEFGYTF